MASEYQLRWRTEHSTVVINNILYCWGGDQEDLPEVHDNEKKKFTSSIDLFHLPTLTWERKSTTGTPPVGVRCYACTKIDNKIFYYGGNCKPDDCYHNNLYELNSINNNWREIANSTPDNVPMKKMRCGMISFKINEKYNLLVLGGYGPVPVTTHSHSQYIPSPNKPNRCFTNEAHIMCVTTSPGQWIVPVITGTRPPPCTGFTMHTLHNNRGVMFGGNTIDETGCHRVDDLYIFSCTHNTIDFQKVVKSTVNWPKKRSFHAGTIINTISNNVVTSHLIISGGLDNDLQTLNDFWIIQLSSFICYKINLPESVIKRYSHSMTTYEISNGHVWITVTGGCSVLNKSFIPITGSDVTFIIELEYINEEWIMKHVWNNEQLMNNKNEIQKRLIHHIVDDRLQEGTLVTDLISLIKSPFTTSQQLETERIIEKKIFDEATEEKLLQQKQLDITQQQLQMLQKDAGKKLHDNEIEIRRQSLELTKEKKRSTDLESELQSVHVIADSRNTYINQLKHELEEKSNEFIENIHQYQILNDQKIHEVTMLNKEVEILKMKLQRSEGQLLEVNLDLWGKDEQLKEMRSREMLLQHKVEKLKQDCDISQQQLSAKQLDITHQHEQLSLLNNELVRNQQNIKHLQSSITRLNQTVQIWKKDTFKAEVERLSISESYQKSGLEESEHLTHSEHETLEGVQVSDVTKSDLNVPQEFEVGTEEIRKLEYLMNEVVSTNQILRTELRKKEELLTQLKNENQEMVSLTSDVQERMSNISVFQSSEVVSKTYRDKDVQDDYLVHLTDRLSGVHIVAEKQFLIRGSKRQAFLWEDFGFNLYFEQGTIHSSQMCPVAVNALVGGAFRFPQDTQLVSAIYEISFAEELLQPVTLEIQHCVLLKSEEQFKYLSFMIAHIDVSAPPYEFHLVNGGKFKVNNLYGRIKRQKFCLVGIAKTLSDGYSSHETSNGEDDPPSDGSQDDDNDETNTNSDIDSEGSNSGNVPEDTNTVNTSNDVPIESTTHVENDDMTIIQTNYDSRYERLYNEIQFPDISYPSLHLLDQFDHYHQDTDSTYSPSEIHDEESTGNGKNEMYLQDTLTINETTTQDLEVHNLSQESNTLLKEDTQSKLTDHHKDSAISASHMKEKVSDSDIPLSDHSANITHHFISVGVQVPGDSDIPDNIYTGGIYFERIASNKWLTRVIIIQNIKVFLEYMEVKHSKAEQDEMIRFQFMDPVNGYIELDMNIPQQRSVKGWTLVPHKRPLRLTKRDADLFGSQELPIPPSCLITVWGKITDDTEDLLSYSVGLNGVDCDSKEICINRFLETSSTTEITHHKPSFETHEDNTLHQVSLTSQKVKEILRISTPEMSRLLSSSDNRISLAMELYGSSLITDDAYSQAIDDSAITNILKGARLMKEITTSVAVSPDKLRQLIEVMKRVEIFQVISGKWERDIQQ